MQPCSPKPSAHAIAAHAEASGLRVERVDALSFGSSSNLRRAVGHFLGRFEPDYVERYQLRAPDGLTWVFVQPYSGQAVMPAEHHFALQGSPAAPLWGEGSRWIDRNRRFVLRLAILFCATLIGIPLGLALFVALVPRAPRLRGAPPAEAIQRTPQLRRLRYVGGLLSRDFLVPWTIQIHALGHGRSRLVCVDPGTVKRGLGILHKSQPEFGHVADLARTAQSLLPRVAHEAQAPHDAPSWDDVVLPWLAEVPIGEAAALAAEPAWAAPAVDPEAGLRKWDWGGLVVGAGTIFVGLAGVALAISMLLAPQSPNAVDSGWFCLISSTALCVLPGATAVLFAIYRLYGRRRSAP